jgi:hypothetical protein
MHHFLAVTLYTSPLPIFQARQIRQDYCGAVWTSVPSHGFALPSGLVDDPMDIGVANAGRERLSKGLSREQWQPETSPTAFSLPA